MMVFVAHPVTGVRRIPDEWLEGFQPSGFREATAAEIAGWYEARELEPPEPPEPLDAQLDAQMDLGEHEERWI